jgi:hypothetical protein
VPPQADLVVVVVVTLDREVAVLVDQAVQHTDIFMMNMIWELELPDKDSQAVLDYRGIHPATEVQVARD